MNIFDSTIIEFINQFSQLSLFVDTTITFIAKNNLAKGGVLLTIFWWGWFRVNKRQVYVRVHLLSTLFSSLIVMAIARILALSLPFRLRPIHMESLDFTLPYNMKLTTLEGWSSFPSDHAVLFYALSTGMFYISKRTGIFAFVYTTLFISLPRIYLGLHFPTDIIGGAYLGIVITLLITSNSFINKISQNILNWSNTKPEIFYPVLFMITYQMVELFSSSLKIIETVLKMF